MQPSTVAIIARNLISNHGWIQYKFGNCKDGFCLIGALTNAARDHKPATITALETCHAIVKAREPASMAGALAPDEWTALVSYNDRDGRTKDDVLAVLKETIRICKHKEES